MSMLTSMSPVGKEGILNFLRIILEKYPQVDEHEFATAYVNFVADNDTRPYVWGAIESFAEKGSIS